MSSFSTGSWNKDHFPCNLNRSRLWCTTIINRLMNKDKIKFSHLPLDFYLPFYLVFWRQKRWGQKCIITSIQLTSKEQEPVSMGLLGPCSASFRSNGRCLLFYNLHLNSKYFTLMHFQRKIQTSCLFLRVILKTSFYVTPWGASWKFLKSHHLYSICGGLLRRGRLEQDEGDVFIRGVLFQDEKALRNI